MYWIVLYLLVILSYKNCLSTNKYSRKFNQLRNETNVTSILDELLKNYDKDIRPSNKKGAPSMISVDIYVRSMSKISELDSEYTFNCYFRQSWRDKRLSFNTGPEMIIVNIKMLEKLWQPYTYFANSNMASVHKIPSYNKFFRINRDGTILYSMRVTITGKCPMDLKNFPIDLQKCPLIVSSFVYPLNEVKYTWNKSKKEKKAIVVAKDMQMSQFDLLSTDEYATDLVLNQNNHSCLIGVFKFKRQLNYFFIQIYLPCILVVLVSWIGFYIEREDAVDRVSLGALSILTMVYLIMECKSDLPKFKYFTALDIYLVVCFIFILSSILEYAVVHLKTKYIDEQDTLTVYRYLSLNRRGLKKFNKSLEEIEMESLSHSIRNNYAKYESETSDESGDDCSKYTPKIINVMNKRNFQNNIKSLIKSESSSCYKKYNRVSKIDLYSRVVYPILFAVFNFFYWKYYLNQRELLSI